MKMQYKKIYFLLPALIIFPLFLQAQCYELIWSDEFDYTGHPDPTYWTAEEGGGGWGNNEWQYYKAGDLDNAKVENGMLTITAIAESYGGRDYTSARLITRGKFNVQYGKIEARMKLPFGQGIWPAFWMMGESITEVGWPACGEIDIMEMIGGNGREKTTHGTLHWDNNGSHAQAGSSYSLESGTFADDFHRFSIEWDEQEIRWYVDDVRFYTINITHSGLSEFHQDFFILLNLAVGGNWPGYPDATTIFPQTLEVDYVRVYKKSTEITELTITGDHVIAQHAARKVFSLPYSSDWEYNWTVPDDALIISGKDSSHVIVNWGCDNGTIICQVTGACDTYEFSKEVTVENNIYGPMFVAENQEYVLFYTDSLSETVLLWTVPSDAAITGGQGTDSIYVTWGNTFEQGVILEIDNNCGTSSLTFNVIKTGQYPYPDIHAPHRIPGTIESVNFDYGGQGIAYFDTDAGNEGSGPRQDTDVDTENNDNGSPNVGWINSGEWLEYTISVDSASYYEIEARVATANVSGGPFSFQFNGEERLNGITVANTGGWRSFKTIKAGTVYLTEADTLMRVTFNTGGFNLGKMTFTATTESGNKIWSSSNLKVFPLPASDYIQISGLKSHENITFFDLKGSFIKNVTNNNSNSLTIDIQSLINGVYFLRIAGEYGPPVVRKIIKMN